MKVPPLFVRRLLVPVYMALLLCLIGAFMVGAVIGVMLLPFGSRHRPLRLFAFGLCYCLMELVVLGVAGVLWVVDSVLRLIGQGNVERWHRWHRLILRGALKWVIAGAIRCAGFELIVSDASASRLSHNRPNLVLGRHGGPGDSFVLVYLLLVKYSSDVRIVLKDALQFDPALDVVLNRLRCCFLSAHRTGAARRQLGSACSTLKPGDVLLLFPEGANWTGGRWAAAVRRLHRHRRIEAARTAELMPNVLPPRLGGVAACLNAQPALEVFVAAHAGLDHLVSTRQIWNQLPFVEPMTVRIWNTSPPPNERTEQASWLTTEWAVVDEWIEGYHAHVIDRPPSG